MDFFDALLSAFSSPSRGRRRTVQQENARAVAFYGLPTLAALGVVAGARGIVALGVLPLLALGLTAIIAPRLGWDAAGSRRLALGSAGISFTVNGLMLLLSQPLF